MMFDSNLDVAIDGNIVRIGYDEYQLNKLQENIIDQSIEIVRMCVDSARTKEPVIQRQGVKNILLQVPGERDSAKLKNLLGKTAKLTFHLVDETTNIEKAKHGHISSGSKAIKSEESVKQELMIIKKKVIVSRDELNNAFVSFNKDSMSAVSFAFNHVGAKKFIKVTSKKSW